MPLNLPSVMRAVLVDSPGGPEQLRLGDHPVPEFGDDDLLVRVHATALNRADLIQRQGKYPPPEGASPLLGLEAAGTVVACGAKVDDWKEGDRVMALLSGGGYAEYARVDRRLAMPVPAALSFEEAAAIPEVFLTAYQALHWLAEMAEGDHVLVHAGASGVGTAALQLVRLAGAHPYATVSERKVSRAVALGAEDAIDYAADDWADRILTLTNGHGADVILDFIGAPYFEDNVRALAVDGRLVLLATLGGGRVDAFNLRTLFRKRARVQATTLRNRSVDYKARLTRAFAEEVLPHFADGPLAPVIDRIYPWEDVVDAHRHMEDNRNVGKIVLRVAS